MPPNGHGWSRGVPKSSKKNVPGLWGPTFPDQLFPDILGPNLGPKSGPKIGPMIWAPGPKIGSLGPNLGPPGPKFGPPWAHVGPLGDGGGFHGYTPK